MFCKLIFCNKLRFILETVFSYTTNRVLSRLKKRLANNLVRFVIYSLGAILVPLHKAEWHSAQWHSALLNVYQNWDKRLQMYITLHSAECLWTECNGACYHSCTVGKSSLTNSVKFFRPNVVAPSKHAGKCTEP